MTDIPSISLRPLNDDIRLNLSFAEIPHPTPFRCAIAVEPAHLSEIVAHVNNIEIVRWLDRAAELHADAGGFTRQRMLDDNIMWFVARHEIDYLAEAMPNDELVLATWLRDVTRVKSWRDYVIVRPGDETIICRAATLWVLVDLDRRRPTRIPKEMINHFLPLQQPVSTSSSPSSSAASS